MKSIVIALMLGSATAMPGWAELNSEGGHKGRMVSHRDFIFFTPPLS